MQQRMAMLNILSAETFVGNFSRELSSTFRELADMLDRGQLCTREEVEKYVGPAGTTVLIMGGDFDGVLAPHEAPDFAYRCPMRLSISAHRGRHFRLIVDGISA